MIINLKNDENDHIVMVCDNEGKYKIEEAIQLLSQLSEQAESLGAMEMGGEIGEAQWNLENLLDMATILQEGKLFTIWFQNKSTDKMVFKKEIFAKSDMDAREVARNMETRFPECYWFVKEGKR